MAPTHELAIQITTVISKLSSMMSGIRIKTIVGGSLIEEDLKINPPHIIVGCPGRVYDMIKRHYIFTNKLKLYCCLHSSNIIVSSIYVILQSHSI